MFLEILMGPGKKMSFFLHTSCSGAGKWNRVYELCTISFLPSRISQHTLLLWNKFYSLHLGILTSGLWSTDFSSSWEHARKIPGEKQANKLLVKGFTCVYRGEFLSVNIISLNPNICPAVEHKQFHCLTLPGHIYLLFVTKCFLQTCIPVLIHFNYFF